jgi:hypothetical protein
VAPETVRVEPGGSPILPRDGPGCSSEPRRARPVTVEGGRRASAPARRGSLDPRTGRREWGTGQIVSKWLLGVQWSEIHTVCVGCVFLVRTVCICGGHESLVCHGRQHPGPATSMAVERTAHACDGRRRGGPPASAPRRFPPALPTSPHPRPTPVRRRRPPPARAPTRSASSRRAARRARCSAAPPPVPHRHHQRPLLPDDDHEFPGPREGRIEQRPPQL